jgi:hypothetical protein
MRKTLLLAASIVFASEDSELIQKIKQGNNKAIEASSITSVKDPFFGEVKTPTRGQKETNITKYEPAFSLKAIFADKALINDKWLAKGESLNGYMLVDIGAKEVLLQRDGEKKQVSMTAVKAVW